MMWNDGICTDPRYWMGVVCLYFSYKNFVSQNIKKFKSVVFEVRIL